MPFNYQQQQVQYHDTTSIMTDSAEKYPMAPNTGASKQKKRSPAHAMNPIALSSSFAPFPGIDFIFPDVTKNDKNMQVKI